MPAYTSGLPLALYPGDSYNVWSAESPADGTASRAVAISPAIDGALSGYSVTYSFANAPGAVSLAVQESDVDSDGSYVTVDTLSSTTGGKATYSGNITKFVRVVKTSQTGGGALTVSVGR